MSSKLALLLKQKHKLSNDDTVNGDAPAKRRKKAAAKSKQPAAGQKQPRKQQTSRQEPLKSKGAASDDADDEEDVAAASAEAYTALMGMLASRRSAVGAALKQQQLQQEGASDASESESEYESGSELVELQEHPDRADEVDRGDMGDDPGAEDGEGAAMADNNRSSDGNQHGEGAEDGTNTQQQQQQQLLGKTAGDAVEHDEDAVAAAAAAVAGAAAAAAVAAGGEEGAGATNHNGSSSGSMPSQWEAFMARELSAAEVAALRSSGSLQWQEAQAADDPTAACWQRARWQFARRPGFPVLHSSLAAYGVKERLAARWQELHGAGHAEDADNTERQASHSKASTSAGGARSSSSSKRRKSAATSDFVSPQQEALFALCDSYADVFYAAKPYPGGPGWSADAPDEDMDAVLLHVLNHCAKTADVIKKNNDKLKAAADPGDVSNVPRDQGFSRAKALILLPMRSTAFSVVRRLVALAMKETRADSVQGKEKFVEQFAGEEEEDERAEAAAAAADDDGDATKKKKKGVLKPAEHRALFRGNTDDHFRLGIRITRGQIKLFADLLQSDIIVASPVGLATKLAEDAAAAAAAAGEKGRKGGRAGKSAAAAPGGEADFLSSIEVCVIDRADMMLMQNWQHVMTVLEALNQLPKQQHGSDIMRVRLHLLAAQGALYRQNIMTSSFATPQLNAAFSKLCCSHAGKFRLVAQPSGVLAQVVPQVRQLFEQFSAPSAAAAADARFDFFRAHVWPRLAEGGGGGLLLVVPSYFDFVRVRNFLKAEEADFAVLSEYSSFSSVTRARALFFQRRRRLLLYTERAHFYHRYRVRGIQDVVFYGLPDHAHFYSELVNLVQAGSAAAAAAAAHHATITTLFCQYDALALGRVVGHSRAAKMLAADTPTFVFC